MSILVQIVEFTRKRVEYEKKLLNRLPDREAPLVRLSQILRIGSPIKLICEYKRASPSGIVNLELTPEDFVRLTSSYASAYSVLTEPRWFFGSYTYLTWIKHLSGKPTLMKDFIVDPWQIDLAYSIGADIVLVIVRVVGLDKLDKFVDYALERGLDVIIEVDNLQDAREISNMYSGVEGVLLGVNARDLSTLQVSVDHACEIISQVDFRGLIVAESGIKSREDIRKLKSTGKVSAVLVGTSIMKNPDIVKELYEEACTCTT